MFHQARGWADALPWGVQFMQPGWPGHYSEGYSGMQSTSMSPSWYHMHGECAVQIMSAILMMAQRLFFPYRPACLQCRAARLGHRIPLRALLILWRA